MSRYDADLVVDPLVAAEVATLKPCAALRIFSMSAITCQQARQRERIHRVAEWLTAAAPSGLDPILVPMWEAAENDTRMRDRRPDRLHDRESAGAHRQSRTQAPRRTWVDRG